MKPLPLVTVEILPTPLPNLGEMTVDTGERFKHIELEINTACDLACFGCDRLSDVTAALNMTVSQVNRFVEESLDLNWEWERIRLLGGEPTLHPHLIEIVELLIEYRSYYPNVFLQVLTNGLGKSTQYREFCDSHNISLHAETKQKDVTPEWFTNTRIVPVDRWSEIETRNLTVAPCGIFGIRGCGVGLTRNGYFIDGAGASIARVAGYDIGVMTLAEVTWEAMLEQSKILCKVCGHWGPDGKRNAPITETGEVTGKFWTETLKKYSTNKPKLRIYGE